MPPLRRSRRLSKQSPSELSEDGWENPGDLISEPTSSLKSSPNTFPGAIFAPSSPVSIDPLPSQPSRTRRRGPGYVPRPPNAFICFRSAVWKKHKEILGRVDHRKLSEQVGSIWRNLSEDAKEPFRTQALHEKASHYERYPDWKYAPKIRKDYPAAKRSIKRKLAVPRTRISVATAGLFAAPATPVTVSLPPVPPIVKQEPCKPADLPFLTFFDGHIEQPTPLTKKEEPSMNEDDAPVSSFDDFVPTEDIPTLTLNEQDYESPFDLIRHTLPPQASPGGFAGFNMDSDFDSFMTPHYCDVFQDPLYALELYPMPPSSGYFSNPWSEGSSTPKTRLSEPPFSPKSYSYGTDSPIIHAPVPSSHVDMSLMEYIAI